MRRRRARWLCLAALLVGGPAPGWAGEGIPPAYRQVGREYGVPPPLLYAVALNESVSLLTSGERRPWPWTLNVQGRAERYRTRWAAWRALQRHLAAGRRSIDIGLMQVNWHWHQGRLQDPWTALDPYFNLRTAARILRERYAESGDWLAAVGQYHAPANPQRAQAYRARVALYLRRLGERLG